MLISDYTFDRFIIGQSNMMARAMAYGVADLVGDRSQIVYIYGDTGLGKTHLLHAIGNNILKYDVLVLLATKIKNDIRGLEGALYHLTMMAEVLNEPITVKFAKDVLKNVLKKK